MLTNSVLTMGAYKTFDINRALWIEFVNIVEGIMLSALTLVFGKLRTG